MLPVQGHRILTRQTHIYGEVYLNIMDQAAQDQDVVDEEVEILILAREAPPPAHPEIVIRTRTIRTIVLTVLPELEDANHTIPGVIDSGTIVHD